MKLLKINLESNQNWIDELRSKDFDAKKIFKDLSCYLMKSDGELDVFDTVRMMDENFMQSDFTVFLSHSHDDLEDGKKIATILEERGEKVFIDSLYWNHFESLLKQIDDQYSKNQNDNSYDYQKRNITTAVVHTLLFISLQKAIYKCDKFIFLDSKSVDKIKVSDRKSTTSPWIFLELEIINMIIQINSSNIFKRGFYNKDIAFNFDIKKLLENFNDIKTKEQLLLNIVGKENER
ncbi:MULTISPECIES: toll/interleukin-1 receptor domain-containing protein [Staphylococcus]|uniref:toll/interleukin-1 receptor domain-containing protein n=1 Tax=Staphylococcus TaxID=1279 RepID=UPI0008A4096B|nr:MULTISPECIES: toll/interleukin-1 receptor domain-containing protein [Staphylococcus]MDT4012497.1 toll/interleukin-1 receptor domain-containing protein [Staphylococcus simulans]OFJ73461.1 hypothetical protein HMPREF2846_02735 [Staphylococcus sp. HMSC056G08]